VAASAPGDIDYRLVRGHVVAEFKRGRLGRNDVCDAHPELLRAARNVGRPTERPCPICDHADLSLVTFAFGPGLPAHGRCITTARELDGLSRRRDESVCYLVEVCTECSWNHLVRNHPVGGRRSS